MLKQVGKFYPYNINAFLKISKNRISRAIFLIFKVLSVIYNGFNFYKSVERFLFFYS